MCIRNKCKPATQITSGAKPRKGIPLAYVSPEYYLYLELKSISNFSCESPAVWFFRVPHGSNHLVTRRGLLDTHKHRNEILAKPLVLVLEAWINSSVLTLNERVAGYRNKQCLYVCNHVSVHFLSLWGFPDALLEGQLPFHAKIKQSETKPGL